MQFNVYLFLPEAKDFEEVFREGQLAPAGLYEEVPLRSPAPFEARAYLLRNKPSVPPWVEFFGPHCEFEDPAEIRNQSNSFVFVLKADGRLFAFTHGQGYLALSSDLTVPGFGLRVALNAIDPAKIRSTESRNLRETATLKQLVLSRPSKLDEFEVNFSRELLYRLEGGLGKPGIGTRIRGSASCGVATRISFEQLEDWCRSLLKIQAQKTPRAMEKADRLRRVTDRNLIDRLDGLLDNALQGSAGPVEALHLSPVNIREYNQVEKYLLRRDGVDLAELDELDVNLVLPVLRGLASTTTPGEVTLVGVDIEGEEVTAQPLRSAVVFEASYQDDRYIHTPDGWVYVSPSLVDWVNEQLSILADPPDGYCLPDWLPAYPTEGDYNLKVAELNGSSYFCLDKKLVTVEKKGRIEVCDLLGKSGDLIHVKEYGGSSQAISHLVAQAQGSSELLLGDRRYRESIGKQLPKAWKKLIRLDRISPRDHQIVFGIGASRARSIPASLPFLSKQSLLRAVESLSLQGFRTFVCQIPKG